VRYQSVLLSVCVCRLIWGLGVLQANCTVYPVNRTHQLTMGTLRVRKDGLHDYTTGSLACWSAPKTRFSKAGVIPSVVRAIFYAVSIS